MAAVAFTSCKKECKCTAKNKDFESHLNTALKQYSGDITESQCTTLNNAGKAAQNAWKCNWE